MTKNKRQEKSGYDRSYRCIGDGNGRSKPSQRLSVQQQGTSKQVPPCEDGYADGQLGKVVARQELAMDSDFCLSDWPYHLKRKQAPSTPGWPRNIARRREFLLSTDLHRFTS